MTDLNTKQSTGSSDVRIVLLGVVVAAAGAMRTLLDTDPLDRVIGAFALVFGTALAVAGSRWVHMPGLTAQHSAIRHGGLALIAVSLIALNGTSADLSSPDRTRRVLGTVELILGVAGFVAGGLSLWCTRKPRS